MKIIADISLGLVTACVVLFLSCLFFAFPFIFVEVCGTSMLPTYQDGELIFAHRFFRKNKIKVGDIVIFREPHTHEKRTLIKRVAHITKDNKGRATLFYCLGDNTLNSHDSRDFGAVPAKLLRGKIISPRPKKGDM